METYTLKKDIPVFCITARSFPGGIMDAFKALEQLHPQICERTFYGLSKPVNDQIVYRAAVEENYEGEGREYGCESFVIKKGEYLAETLINLKEEETSEKIGKAFEQLLSTPLLDYSTYCIEWYKGKGQVVCMVQIDPRKQAQL